MKTIDISASVPSLESLLAEVGNEDIVIVRDGHAVARVSAFSDEDLDDWLFERDPVNIARADQARAEVREGKGRSLEEVQRS